MRIVQIILAVIGALFLCYLLFWVVGPATKSWVNAPSQHQGSTAVLQRLDSIERKLRDSQQRQVTPPAQMTTPPPARVPDRQVSRTHARSHAPAHHHPCTLPNRWDPVWGTCAHVIGQ